MYVFYTEGKKIDTLVSIITPVYNRRQLIKECIESVISQTYPNWEMIAVDDGSNDGTWNYLEHIGRRHKRIFPIRKTGTKGAPSSRNIGLKAAKGEYVIFLDSDDLLLPFCLEARIKKTVQTPRLDFVVFPQKIFVEQSAKSYLVNIKTGDNDLDRFLTFAGNIDVPWWITGPLWKRDSLLTKNLFWNETLYGYQDVHFHICALIEGLEYEVFDAFPPDCVWRQHGQSERISPTHQLLEKVPSHEYLLNIVYDQLVKKDKLNELRRMKIAEGMIELCVACYLKHGAKKAARQLVNRLSSSTMLSESEKAYLKLRFVVNNILFFSDTLSYVAERQLKKYVYPFEKNDSNFWRHKIMDSGPRPMEQTY